MGFDTFFHYLNLILQVFVVNLLLSGDNAVVIALACRSLPAEMTRRAMLLGIEAAIMMRILLTIVAAALMRIPLLKLAGGVALAVIAIKLTTDEREKAESGASAPAVPVEFWSAVGTIFVADLVMSVDNVVALAAVAQGSIVILSTGLLMSVPFLLYGSLFVTSLLRRHPLLKRGGGAMLGWLAGDIAISDPFIADWVNQQSPALTVVVPILVVIFVLVESRIMERTQAAAFALRPARTPRPAAVRSAAARIAEVSRAQPVATPPVTAPPVAATPPPVTATPPPVAATPPRGPAADADIDAPRSRRKKIILWIAIAGAVVLLWLFMRLLSLDYSSSAPAIQWTAPTGTR